MQYNWIHNKNGIRKIQFYYTIHTHANVLLSHKPKLVHRVPAASFTTTTMIHALHYASHRSSLSTLTTDHTSNLDFPYAAITLHDLWIQSTIYHGAGLH
jgi:hypothetical protein